MARESRLTSGPAIVGYIAALELLIHLPNPGGYGLFTDELYFLACGEHLAFGYVDMPPLTAIQAWLVRATLGDSMLAIRLLPTLFAAGLVLLAGVLVRQLGGGRFAQALAAVAVLIAPFYLSIGSYLSMNSVEPILWMGCAAVLIRMIQTGDGRLWIWFGVIAGVGMENKDTMLLFGFALIAGLLMTPERWLLRSKWLLVGGAIAGLIFLPNLIWMIQHHFPHLEMLANIRRSGRNVAIGPLGFIGWQILGMQPVAFPIWICGLWVLVFSGRGRPYRALGYAYLLALVLLLVLKGRFYYLAPAYPMLLAAGAVAIEGWLKAPRWRWVGPVYLGLLGVSGGIIALVALPILPPETYIRYTQLLHFSEPRIENRKTSALPQTLADRMGWLEMAQAVATVYGSIPADERADTVIFGKNYGEAGAIDFYGPKLGLPKAISGHDNYWYWGPRGYTGKTMIFLGDIPRETLERGFKQVEARGVVGNPYAMASEHFTIYLCRDPKGWTLQQVWPRLKNWD